jgi:hypothetical protein
MRFKGMYGCAQMQTVLQDVEFNDQQRFNQFVAQSKSHMEVGCVLYVSTTSSCVSLCHKTDTSRIVHILGRYQSSQPNGLS